MKKILITVGGFYPAQKFGGPAVSILNLCRLIEEEFYIVVVTANHDLNSNHILDGIDSEKRIMGNISIYYLPEQKINFKGISVIVKKEKPELIYVNSLFSAKYFLPAICLSKKYDIPFIVAPRGELCENAFKKKIKKLVYLKYVNLRFRLSDVFVHITADNEYKGVKTYLQNRNDHIFLINNIPTLSMERKGVLEKRQGKCKIVYISRIHPKKNLKFALEVLQEVHADIEFDIYGPIEIKEYWNECKNVIDNLPANINVVYRGELNHEDVIKTFGNYHLFFFPTFSENYGHVIAEALLAGCPVLTSDQVPWTDMQKNGCGFAISLDLKQKFVDKIQAVSDWDKNEYGEAVECCLSYAKQKFDFNRLKEQYSDMFNRVIEKEKDSWKLR